MSNPNQGEIDQWKSKYLKMGVPETLLNTMIAEAEAEWESIIGFGDINNFADLTVIIDDIGLNEGEFYKIVITGESKLLAGEITTESSYKFSQLPCINLIVEVYKIAATNDLIAGYMGDGLTLLIGSFYARNPPPTPYVSTAVENFISAGVKEINHSRDEEITVTLALPSPPLGYYLLTFGEIAGENLNESTVLELPEPFEKSGAESTTQIIIAEASARVPEILEVYIDPPMSWDINNAPAESLSYEFVEPMIVMPTETLSYSEGANVDLDINEIMPEESPTPSAKTSTETLILTIT